jgi:serine phosphatase RsbU (regulator of sigma subunit)
MPSVGGRRAGHRLGHDRPVQLRRAAGDRLTVDSVSNGGFDANRMASVDKKMACARPCGLGCDDRWAAQPVSLDDPFGSLAGRDRIEELHRVELLAADLAHLDSGALLDVLLERVQHILAVDTVAVLLVDTAATQLVAHATRGLDEELRQGTRVPIGRGFAGRIASEGTPIILDEVGPDVVVNPILWRKGIKALLGVPMIVAGTLIGVMHVGVRTARTFTTDDATVLQLAADRIAAAITAEQALSERSAARTLQRSLLPPRLPNVQGTEFAARLIAAEDIGIGGDWYDAFVLPTGHIGIVMGDVAGRGLRAAVVMGRMRSVLRAYALLTLSPAEVLASLDRKFAHFEPTEMATVLYVLIDPTLEQFVVSSAGHLPPIIAEPGASARLLRLRPGPPIGALLDERHRDVTVELPPGAAMACYTDGLVERRHEMIDAGLERLRAAFYAGPLESVCTTVMTELLGADVVHDDVALLTFRRT